MAESVLISTLGSEPQVVTLALDQLLADGYAINRVTIVHTRSDQEPVRSSLAALHDEFVVNRFYGPQILYTPHLLADSSGPLMDVATGAELEGAFHSLYMLLRGYKHAGYTLHLCIAGGRKTMAMFAMAAAQILFDPNDCVWHLVSNPALVHSRQLHAADIDEVELVPIPIAQWGQLQTGDRGKVQDFVDTVLTPAERELTVLLIQEGLSNAGLAARLNKSVKTVANQLSSVYVKMQEYFALDAPPNRALLLVMLGSYS